MSPCRHIALLCALLLPLAPQAAELVILVDTATEMPMARFDRFRLVDGIHKDVGEALAAALGRTPRFVALPRKRIAGALDTGSADLLCGYVPEWLDGAFGWSQPFFPMLEEVISDSAGTRPRSLADLRGELLGTVFGYQYPDIERALGKGFLRADGPSSEINLRKLAAGRLHHVITMKTFIDYRMKLGDPVLSLHAPLPVKNHLTRCAVSRKGRVSVAEVDRAIAAMVRGGAVGQIAARYQ